MNQSWPVAELDSVRRLHIMAAANPTASHREWFIDAPFDRVWSTAGNLEQTMPYLIHDIRWMRIVSGDGDRLEALARGYLGQRARFDVVLRPGWCWMQSRFLVGGMAAVPEGDGTRFAFLGGLRIPTARMLHPILKAAGRPLLERVAQRLEHRIAESP